MQRKGFDMSETTIDYRNALATAWKCGVLLTYGQSAGVLARFNALIGEGTRFDDLEAACSAGQSGESFAAFVARRFPEGGAA